MWLCQHLNPKTLNLLRYGSKLVQNLDGGLPTSHHILTVATLCEGTPLNVRRLLCRILGLRRLDVLERPSQMCVQVLEARWS